MIDVPPRAQRGAHLPSTFRALSHRNFRLWFMGQGISLQALGRRDEAKAAFQRALDSGGLSPDLKVFVERQMAALRAAPAN